MSSSFNRDFRQATQQHQQELQRQRDQTLHRSRQQEMKRQQDVIDRSSRDASRRLSERQQQFQRQQQQFQRQMQLQARLKGQPLPPASTYPVRRIDDRAGGGNMAHETIRGKEPLPGASHDHPPVPHEGLPGRRPAATASPAPGSADLVHRRQLEKSVSWSGRERLRCLWYRLRLTVAEMNYATRRIVELQAPWISDDHPSR